MKEAKALKEFFHTLTGLQGGIALFARGDDELLLDCGYPDCNKELEAIRNPLEELGLYELLRDAITQSEILVREGKYEEAETLVLEANRKLSKASGVEDDLRRLYKSANS
jgi:hypothetical protein